MMKHMKKKTLFLLFTLSLCTFYGCTKVPTELTESSETVESAPVIQEVEALSDAEIIIPAALAGDEISEYVTEASTTDETGSPENSIKVSLPGDERTKIVNEISTEISNNIKIILENDDYYPDIVSITPNSDCTEFTIALKDGIMNTYESMLVMSFYMVGNKYQIYSGIPEEQAKTVVRYINADTEEIISETDSSSMNTFSE